MPFHKHRVPTTGEPVTSLVMGSLFYLNGNPRLAEIRLRVKRKPLYPLAFSILMNVTKHIWPMALNGHNMLSQCGYNGSDKFATLLPVGEK